MFLPINLNNYPLSTTYSHCTQQHNLFFIERLSKHNPSAVNMVIDLSLKQFPFLHSYSYVPPSMDIKSGKMCEICDAIYLERPLDKQVDMALEKNTISGM